MASFRCDGECSRNHDRKIGEGSELIGTIKEAEKGFSALGASGSGFAFEQFRSGWWCGDRTRKHWNLGEKQ